MFTFLSMILFPFTHPFRRKILIAAYLNTHTYFSWMLSLEKYLNIYSQINFGRRRIFFLVSDHGYHAGCSVARKIGAKGPNLCCDHPEPHDCKVWDFKKDTSTDINSDCTRRTLSIVSGGALDPKHKGKVIKKAEIIDVIPTIAEVINIPYECEGKSIFSHHIREVRDYGRL